MAKKMTVHIGNGYDVRGDNSHSFHGWLVSYAQCWALAIDSGSAIAVMYPNGTCKLIRFDANRPFRYVAVATKDKRVQIAVFLRRLCFLFFVRAGKT